MKKYVIIGGGAASVGCIEGIRSVDTEGEIVLVSGEGRPVYCRPLISYYLQGRTKLENMSYRPDDFYEKNGCRLIYARALSVDPASHSVRLSDGQTLSYDALCAATGSEPFVPPFKGLDTVENSFSFLTLDDALALDKAVTRKTRVLIAGAGLIGLKCAEGLCGRVGSITVFDLAPRVLSSVLDADCAALLQNRLEENGVELLLSDSAESFDGNTVYMKSGRVLEFDVLVLAVGVRPSVSLIKDAGGETGRGILVDTSMKTTLADIYAAGDCAEGYDASLGARRVLAVLPNAYMQGFCAGVNMAGGKEIFDTGIPMNAIGFFGLHALTAGCCEGEMLEEETDGGLKRLFIKDGRLSGFMLIGDSAGAGILTSLVRQRAVLDGESAAALLRAPTLAVLSEDRRKIILGGAV